MDPLLLASLLKGGASLISAVLAGKQHSEAKQLEKENVRPVEAVPQGALDATAELRLLSEVGLPAEQMNAARRDIDRAGSKAISTATDRRSAVDMISTIQQASR
jgi:hypothetical protein